MDQEIRPVEIKDLNKTQLIWLAVLISFIVSIATGIVTVTLMQQAPVGVTQTINRVVQQTVEKVVPGYTSTTQTVVVKEDDLVANVVDSVRGSMGSLYLSKESKDSIDDVYSIGDGNFLVADATIDGKQPYYIGFGDGVYAVKSTTISPLGFSILFAPELAGSATDTKKIPFGKESTIKTGQSAVLVSQTLVRKGIIQSIRKASTESPAWNEIVLDPAVSSVLTGAVAVNFDGSIIGIVAPSSDGGTLVIGVDAITAFIKNPAIPPPSPTTTPSPSTN